MKLMNTRMTLAVVQIGGKQHIVHEGDVIRVEKLDASEGDTLVFDTVMLMSSEKKTTVGMPIVSGAKVEVSVVSHGRDKKVWGIKHKAKKRYKMKFGHKQPHTMIRVERIA
jgi:large subunit ribosomal protein L21